MAVAAKADPIDFRRGLLEARPAFVRGLDKLADVSDWDRKLPEGTAQSRRTDNTLVKALARAFRWKRMLESGEFATVAELAEREGIAPSYMTRVLRLTLLAPDIVEAILEGRQSADISLAGFMKEVPVVWNDQTP
jgi:hypothetical protein